MSVIRPVALLIHSLCESGAIEKGFGVFLECAPSVKNWLGLYECGKTGYEQKGNNRVMPTIHSKRYEVDERTE